MRRIITNFLREAGCDEIQACADGARAGELFGEEGPFQIVVTEYDLPGSTGLDLVRTLRKDQDASQLSILMVSTRNSRSDVTEALESGIDAYVLKPFSAEALSSHVASIVTRHSDEEDAKEEGEEREIGEESEEPAREAA
jgi:two-component system chemotaxis response regulator CheY